MRALLVKRFLGPDKVKVWNVDYKSRLLICLLLLLCAASGCGGDTEPRPSGSRSVEDKSLFEEGFEGFLRHQDDMLFPPPFFKNSDVLKLKGVEAAFLRAFENAKVAVRKFHSSRRAIYSAAFDQSTNLESLRMLLNGEGGVRSDQDARIAETFGEITQAELIDFSSARASNLPKSASKDGRMVFYAGLANFLKYELESAYRRFIQEAEEKKEKYPEYSKELKEWVDSFPVVFLKALKMHESRQDEYLSEFLSKHEQYHSFELFTQHATIEKTTKWLAIKFSDYTGAKMAEYE